MEWVAKIGQKVLGKKKLPVEDYVNSLAEGTIPLDQLGLLCVARNWHIHICVFLKSGIWTTRKDNSLEGVSIYLLYAGSTTFFDTVYQEYTPPPDPNWKVLTLMSPISDKSLL